MSGAGGSARTVPECARLFPRMAPVNGERVVVTRRCLFLLSLLNIYHQAVVIFSHQRFIKLTNTSFFKSLDDLKDGIFEHFKVFDVFNR